MQSLKTDITQQLDLPELAVPPRASAQTRRLTKILGYSLMLLSAITTLEIASYMYLRAFQGYDGRHLMTYQFDDYKNIQLTPEYRNSRGVYHNAQGFRRDHDTPKEKPPHTFRIFILGGSTAYGLGSQSAHGQTKYAIIRNDETIDHYLEDYLRDATPFTRVEVINAAITSHQSHHHLIYLNQTILKYRPDMVIFIDGFNDYYPYTRGFDQFRNYAYQERSHRFLGEPSINAWLGYTGWWLFRKSHFVHLTSKSLLPLWIHLQTIARGNARNRINVDDALQNLRVNAGDNFIKMVERSALILRHEGVIPVFTLQPEIVFRQKKVLTAMERNIVSEMANHWQENFVEFKNRARPMVSEYMQRATNKTGGFFFDLTDIFGGMEEDAYTDYTHLTPMGNRRLAEYLGARLLPIIADVHKNKGGM